MQPKDKTAASPKTSKLSEKLASSKVNKEFKLGEVLAEDVTGAIYAAEMKFRGKEVAVNVLAESCSILSDKLVKIDHPNIARAYKILKLKDGTCAIVIEKPEGRPILEFMGSEGCGVAFSIAEGISAILQLLSALHAIHQAGQTARNLNVNNVFLFKDRNGNLRLKLVSLGIGGAGINLKSPHYLSPERIMNIDKDDPRSDIWAAGAVFYHLCFGRPPFGGKEAYEVAKKNMLETPDFEARNPALPDALIDVLKRALERDENKRYQTVTEMVSELLPLREMYNAPMSDDVSKALKRSYPPSPLKSSPKIVPKKPMPLKGTMIMGSMASKKPERKDNTVGYGKENRDKKSGRTSRKPRSLFKMAEVKSRVAARVQRSVGMKKPDPSKTLLGIPAMTTDDPANTTKSGIEPRTTGSEKSPSDKSAMASFKPEKLKSRSKSKKMSGEFFSPRSILGSDEDIKALENEMSFLEEAENDGDVPTLVANQDTFQKIVGSVAKLSSPDGPATPVPDGKKQSATKKTKTVPPLVGSMTPVPADRKQSTTKKTKTVPPLVGSMTPVPAAGTQSAPKKTVPPLSETAQTPAGSSPPLEQVVGAEGEAENVTMDVSLDMVSEVVNMVSSDVVATPQISQENDSDTRLSVALSRLALLAAATLKDVARNRRLLTGIVGGALMLLGLLIGLIVGGQSDGDAARPEAPRAVETAAAAQGSGVTAPEKSSTIAAASKADRAGPAGGTENPVDPAASPTSVGASEPTVAAETETAPMRNADEDKPATVTITLTDLPKGARVKINGKPTIVPVVTSLSEKPVVLSVSAPGYKPFQTKVVLDDDKEVPVAMEKAPVASKKKAPAKPVAKKKRNPKKRSAPKRKSKALVSNPFKN